MHREAVDWEKDLELMVETVEAGGNDVLNPLAEEAIMFCSSDISGGYRALLTEELDFYSNRPVIHTSVAQDRFS